MAQQEDKTRIIIFGKNGQVASSLIEEFALESKGKNFYINSYSSQDVDFSDLKSLSLFLETMPQIPDFIINAAAYTNVDKAEEEKELAELINHKAVEVIAKYCAKNRVKLIHYSTDYVFDGLGDQPFKADNTKNLNPLNYYGKTKLGGEMAIISSGCDYMIFRTSWVYSKNGKNFVNTIKRLAQEREEISIVCDQIGALTDSKKIAKKTIRVINSAIKNSYFPRGIYHLVGDKVMSRYEFALGIVADLQREGIPLKVKKIKPIKTFQYKTLAVRPLNSRLDC